MNGKERVMSVISGKKADRTPVFPLLMSFAQIRNNITYKEFAKDGHALAEAQLNICEMFPQLDALTVSSDAFRIPADLGASINFPDDKPPHAEPLIKTEEDLMKLKLIDPTTKGSRMADRLASSTELQKTIGKEKLICGWVEMPFAEACSLCGITEFMTMLVLEEQLAHKVLDFCTEININFALAQLETGVPMIGAGDAAASLISPTHYKEFAYPYEKRVIDAISHAGGLTKLHICGNTTHLLSDMADTGADLINVDHMVDFTDACRVYGDKKVPFKGNLNPVSDLLQSKPEKCFNLCHELINKAADLNYMLSAGCEIPADTPNEVFKAFCESVESNSIL